MFGGKACSWWHSFIAHDSETGARRSFFIEYVLYGPEGDSPKPVFAYNRSGKPVGQRPAYLMVKAGCWGEGRLQLHRFYGVRRVEMDDGIPFSISAGECFLTVDALKGNINVSEDEARQFKEWMSDPGYMSWSLVHDGKGRFSGEVVLGDRLYKVLPKDSRGCVLADRCPDLAAARALLVLPGVLAFDSNVPAPCLCRRTVSCREAQRSVIWHIEEKSLLARTTIDVTCRKQDLVLNRYESADGGRRSSRLWTGQAGGGTVLRKRLFKPAEKLRLDNVFCEFSAAKK